MMNAAKLVYPVALALGISGGLGAQTSSVAGPPMQVSADIATLLLESMAADLRNLVVAQEQHFADNNRYGRTLSSTDRRQVYIVPSPGVTLTMTYVTMNSWAGRANHEWLRWSCVIVVGDVPPSRIPRTAVNGLPPKEEGRPICDVL